MNSETVPPAATQVRWSILAVATLSSLLLYLDRISANFIVDSIRLEFGASQTAMGWYLGAFFWSYALGQVPAGWLSDRFGIRITLTAYILLWSGFTALLGLSTGLGTLIAYRLGCGLAQAGAYPSCGRAVRDWLPLTQRGMASSVVAFGGRVGGAIAPLLTAVVMLWFALSAGTPEIRPDEIRDAWAIVEVFSGQSFAPNSSNNSSPAKEAPWQEWLRNTAEGRIFPLDDLTDSTAGVASGLQPERNTAPFGPEIAANIAELLNELNPIEKLREQPQLSDWKLPPSAEKIVRQAAENPEDFTQNQPRRNRQFWETVFPHAISKLESRGWRSTMMLFGGVGIVVAAIFWIIFRNQPENHPWVNAQEVALIGNSVETPASSVTKPARFPWSAILSDIGLWGNCLCQFGTNIGWLFLVTWFSRYLDEVHRVPVVERGAMVSLPIFSGMFGMLAGGPLTDVLTRNWGLRWGRRLPIASSRIIAASGYGICALATTGMFGELGTRGPAWMTVFGLAIVAISTDLGVAATWAYAQDIAGKNTAAVLGWGNMWGNLGAAMAPPLYNLVLGEKAELSNWNWLFAFCATAFLISAFGGWLMDSSRPLEAEEIPV